MKAIIYFSLSRKGRCREIASTFEGSLFEIVNLEKAYRAGFINMLVYGFKSVSEHSVQYVPPLINFDDFNEVVLVSPVWAGKVNLYMRKYLETVPFKNKKVTLVGNCDSGYKNYFESYEGLIDKSNKVVDKQMYIKGKKVT